MATVIEPEDGPDVLDDVTSGLSITIPPDDEDALDPDCKWIIPPVFSSPRVEPAPMKTFPYDAVPTARFKFTLGQSRALMISWQFYRVLMFEPHLIKFSSLLHCESMRRDEMATSLETPAHSSAINAHSIQLIPQ